MAPGSALRSPSLGRKTVLQGQRRYSQVLGCYVSHCKSRGWFSAFQKKLKWKFQLVMLFVKTLKVTVPENRKG